MYNILYVQLCLAKAVAHLLLADRVLVCVLNISNSPLVICLTSRPFLSRLILEDTLALVTDRLSTSVRQEAPLSGHTFTNDILAITSIAPPLILPFT